MMQFFEKVHFFNLVLYVYLAQGDPQGFWKMMVLIFVGHNPLSTGYLLFKSKKHFCRVEENAFIFSRIDIFSRRFLPPDFKLDGKEI